MQGPSPSMEPTVSPGSRSSAGTRLHGRWLLFTRTLWVVVVTLSVGLFITASVQYAPQLSAPQNFFQASLLHPDPSLSGFFTFNSHTEALMFGSAAGLLSVFTSISSVIWIAVGLVLFWRKSDDWMTLLAAFSATLRHEVNLDQLREELLAVVQETMQPAHISLWLRPPAQNRKDQATGSGPPPAP